MIIATYQVQRRNVFPGRTFIYQLNHVFDLLLQVLSALKEGKRVSGAHLAPGSTFNHCLFDLASWKDSLLIEAPTAIAVHKHTLPFTKPAKMGIPTMETATGEGFSSVAIFIGIAVTQASFKSGLTSYSKRTHSDFHSCTSLDPLEYWNPVMQEFRSINEELARHGARYLSEELLLMIQTYVKAEGDRMGRQTQHHSLSDHVSFYFCSRRAVARYNTC